MFFFIKPSVIHLDCFTQDERVHKFYPVAPATQFIPEWWRQLPKTYKSKEMWWGSATMKSCPGFTEYYRNSITIPMWSDVIIEVFGQDQGYRWQFADHKTHAVPHDEAQFKNFIDLKDYAQIKINNPWYFKTKKSVKWMWNFPIWNYSTPDSIMLLPGVTDFRYSYTTNLNLVVNKSKERQIVINEGIPIVNFIPLSDKRVKIHNHLISSTEYSNFTSSINLDARFLNSYRKNIQDIDKLSGSKCPFGFGGK